MQVIFGGINTNLGTGTEYNSIMGNHVWTATEDERLQPLSVTGSFSDLHIELTVAPGSGKSRTFAIRNDGSTSDLSVTISNTATTGSNVVNTSAFTPGEKVSIIETGANTPDAGAAIYSVRWNPTTANEFIILGNATGITGAQTWWATIAGSDLAPGSTEGPRESIFPTGGVIDDLYVISSANPGSGGDAYTFTMRKNGANDDLLSATITDAATDSSDTTHTATMAGGDRISMALIPSVTPATLNLGYGLRFVPTIAGESVMLGISSSDLNDTSVVTMRMGMTGGMGGAGDGAGVATLGQNIASIKKFFVACQTAPGSGKSYLFEVMKNVVATNVSVTISGTDKTGNNIVNVAEYDDFDTIGGQATPSGTPDEDVFGYGLVISNVAVPPSGGSGHAQFQAVGILP